MIIFKKVSDLQHHLVKKAGKTGFVPTMGALHNGHISLVESSNKENQFTVCSIFVNPVQFNDPKDFEKYPVTIENDIRMLEAAGCDILFLPSVNEVYPQGFQQTLLYDLGYLETVLEGRYRPGHFQGVCMVMDRLLEIVSCQNLYIGQKDYQQCMVIKRLAEIKGVGSSLNVIICPTLREPDGLAMSSRNMRLDEKDRQTATTIYKTLCYLRDNYKNVNIAELKKSGEQLLLQNGFKPDYVEIADAENLQLLKEWDGNKKAVALVAAFLNDVRLIDNMILN